MPQHKPKVRNPFYPLLIVSGVVFAVTAVAYGIMALEAVQPVAVSSPDTGQHPLLAWLSVYGDRTMFIELAVLGVLTVAAMGSDSYWQRRSEDPAATPNERAV